MEKITGTDIPNTTVTVTAAGEAETVTAGNTLQFTAKAIVDETGLDVEPSATFSWSVSGGKESTSISEAGLLTVGADETAETELTVMATYTKDGVPYTGTATVKVALAG